MSARLTLFHDQRTAPGGTSRAEEGNKSAMSEGKAALLLATTVGKFNAFNHGVTHQKLLFQLLSFQAGLEIDCILKDEFLAMS